ncbi:hypothetical protein EON65_26235 [archaeon]|nr:MAG: hypothetical protein EON65_26235 [archaeon]
MSMMSSYLSGRSGSQSLSVNSSKDRRYNNGNSIALPLLKLDPSGTFILTEATLQWLEEQSSTKGVAILGVSGSGKSFLLNCLAQNPAFRYARGTTSITQGVDMFILPEAEEHDERTILFDVEGSGSRSSEYHAKLLGPMMLIASVIILNFKDRPQITSRLLYYFIRQGNIL